MPIGSYQLTLDKDKIHSYYLLEGEALIKGKVILEHDFIIVEDEIELNIVVNSDVRIFQIAVPKQLTYKTYLELIKN